MQWLDKVLAEECMVFCRYLIACDPDPYVIEKYRLAHRLGHPHRHNPLSRFDEILVRFARTHLLAVQIVDAYSSMFYKASPVRSKLVLLLAILECSPRTFEKIDRPREYPACVLYSIIIAKGLMFGAILLTSLVLLIPLHLLLTTDSKAPR